MPWTVRLYHLNDGQRPWPSFEPMPDDAPIFVEFSDLPPFDDQDYPFLRLIDPYGHTFLSEYQVFHAVLPELERFSATRTSPGLTALITLAGGMASQGHRYLLFDGD
jgi:hypothetical protein